MTYEHIIEMTRQEALAWGMSVIRGLKEREMEPDQALVVCAVALAIMADSNGVEADSAHKVLEDMFTVVKEWRTQKKAESN